MTSLFYPFRQTAFVWTASWYARASTVLLAGIVQIEIHLSGVGVSELTNLQIDAQPGNAAAD
jgi:hypothetical protein